MRIEERVGFGIGAPARIGRVEDVHSLEKVAERTWVVGPRAVRESWVQRMGLGWGKALRGES